MANKTLLQESIEFRSIPGVAGFQILDAVNTPRDWKWLNTAFSLAVLTNWHGQVRYRRHRLSVEPGTVVCTVPGEIHCAVPRLQSVGAGTFHALIIETELFQALSSERGLPHSRAQSLKVHEKLSQALASRATELLRFARSGATEMQAQSGVIGLFEMVVEELIDQPLPARVTKDLPLRAAEKIRECLHSDEGGALNLDQLAERVGMSRFQVLRAFRARYGLPPYAYQLCARVARARKLLSSGRAPAEVSAKCGFADQSHFGRHFKRLVGITPAQYARASNGAAHLRPNEFGLWDVVGAPDSRKAPAQGRP